jgi:hypothetical protein
VSLRRVTCLFYQTYPQNHPYRTDTLRASCDVK